MECPKCGQSLGSAQVHPEAQCRKQQEVNRINLGAPCPWCAGIGPEHKKGCPRHKDDESTPGVEVMTRRR
jgi:hypothetical protein